MTLDKLVENVNYLDRQDAQRNWLRRIRADGNTPMLKELLTIRVTRGAAFGRSDTTGALKPASSIHLEVPEEEKGRQGRPPKQPRARPSPESIRDSVYSARMWKLREGGEVFNCTPEEWRRRYIWIGKSGRFYYDKEEEARDVMVFRGHGAREGVEVERIVPGDAIHKHVILISVHGTEPFVLAGASGSVLDQMQEVIRLMLPAVKKAEKKGVQLRQGIGAMSTGNDYGSHPAAQGSRSSMAVAPSAGGANDLNVKRERREEDRVASERAGRSRVLLQIAQQANTIKKELRQMGSQRKALGDLRRQVSECLKPLLEQERLEEQRRKHAELESQLKGMGFKSVKTVANTETKELDAFDQIFEEVSPEEKELRRLGRELGINIADLQDLKWHFDRLDGDQSGFLDFAEFEELVRSSLPASSEMPRENQMAEWWGQIDEDDSGSISFKEFALWWAEEMM